MRRTRASALLALVSMLGAASALSADTSGTFAVTSYPISWSNFMSSAEDAHISTGDFDGDGRTDFALTGFTSESIPVALSNGDGSFAVWNQTLGKDPQGQTFMSLSEQQGAQTLAGDFDGDGRTDLALTGANGWTTIPVAWARSGQGVFWMTNRTVDDFAGWAAYAGVDPLVGDFNGDGKDDIALIGVSTWRSLPVALSNGDGTFTVANAVSTAAGTFAQLSAAAGTRPFVGDFCGGGEDDIALLPAPSPTLTQWTYIPLACSQADSPLTFSFPSAPGSVPVQNFLIEAAWFLQSSAAVAGDFNGDARMDLCLFGANNQYVWVAFSRGDGNFEVTTQNVLLPSGGDFPSLYNGQKLVATPLTGDFNGDGRTDLALTGIGAWTTLPVAFANGSDGSFTAQSQTVQWWSDLGAPNAGGTAWTGDFNADGKTDVAIFNPTIHLIPPIGAPYSPLTVAFSTTPGPRRVWPWVQLVPSSPLAPNGAQVRAVVERGHACPQLEADGARLPMTVRASHPFSVMVCEAPVPAGALRLEVTGIRLRPPPKAIQSVAVIGDTGCRINDKAVQDCKDILKWPWATVADNVAHAKPDFVIHVGDYFYREAPCPADKQSLCGGSPYGDNWPAWKADFFAPGAPLLSAVPWVFVRGNHEDCNRAGTGWFTFFDPGPPPATCNDEPNPYAIALPGLQLIVINTSSAGNQKAPFYAPAFQTANNLATASSDPSWLLMHHPLWAVAQDHSQPGSSPNAVTTELQIASGNNLAQGIELLLTGHIHLFEAIGFGGTTSRVPGFVLGMSGTALDPPLTAPVEGQQVAGETVVSGVADSAFGYTIVRPSGSGWNLMLFGLDREPIYTCSVAEETLDCEEE